MRLSLKTLGFFNEILSSIQKLIYDEVNNVKHKEVEDKYYYTPVDDYFNFCMKIGKTFGTSPHDIYNKWSLPMVIVTYVYIHNENVTEFGYQQDLSKSSKPPVIHYEKQYIKNVTPEMLEALSEKQDSKYAPEQEALMAMYERTT